MQKEINFKFSVKGLLKLIFFVAPLAALKLVFYTILYKGIIKPIADAIGWGVNRLADNINRAFRLRQEPMAFTKFMLMLACLVCIFWVWNYYTGGPIVEYRRVSPLVLPSPGDIVDKVPSLINDKEFFKSLGFSMMRIFLGLLLAIIVGVPLGLLAGVFKYLDYFLKPVTQFLTNAPVVVLIPLTIAWMGVAENQKIFVIFIGAVGFLVRDSVRAVDNVPQDDIDVSLTMGGQRFEISRKIIFREAMSEIYDRIKVVLSLTFTYIIVAEMIDAKFGIGKIINEVQQGFGPREYIYAILFALTIISILLDRLLVMLRKPLFPHEYV
jgi:NitT/TauT family transport system permease protein